MSDPSDPTILRALVDRLIPKDDWPGALATGAFAHVASCLAAGGAAGGEVRSGLAALDAGARARHGRAFAALDAAVQDALLVEHVSADWFRTVNEWAAEGFYADPGQGGNAGEIAWRMVGYEPRLPPVAGSTEPQGAPGLNDIETTYDAIVVGAGAGGGVVACVLAEAGRSVLLIERGAADSVARAMPRDHLRNQRLSAYGHNAGPDIDGHPRVLIDPEGREHVLRPHEAGYQNNAAAVGSGTVVYGAQAWRFHPDDFRMASRYGVPAGSSLADWPFDYEDLAPYYERAEWELGVAGRSDGLPSPRRRDYPMPPFPGFASRAALTRGAHALGLSTVIPPLLINSVPRDGRPACAQCGSCVGFACPVDAKNGTQNTVIARALATGRCRLITSATVTRIDTTSTGAATGVTFVDATNPDGPPVKVKARSVVLSAGAIETARLLLMSATEAAPRGLGNGSDMVGRNLQGHYSPMVYGRFADPVYDPRGPGVTTATCDYNHGNPGVIGGSMIADDFIMLPIIFWKRALPPGAPRWGGAGKAAMRDHYRNVARLYGPVQEIPNPDCRVTLDPRVRDRFGLPVARLAGTVHPETVRTAGFIRERATEWLRASGAVEIWSGPMSRGLSAGQHQAGTCRMGRDPASSVTDPFGRVWGHDNLFIADGSLHPTNGGFNPVLTILALAYRVADAVMERAPDRAPLKAAVLHMPK